MDDWPFDQPPNCAVITVRAIANRDLPILHVSHDADDHGWQFLTGGALVVEEAVMVSLREILELDESIWELADLPPGWIAWRESSLSGWIREIHPDYREGHRP